MQGVDLREISLTTGELLQEACRTAKDRTFVVFPHQKFEQTFGEFQAQINRLSNVLRGRGITRGDKVCIMSDNSPELLHTFSAVTNIGAIWVPVNSRLVGESLRYIVDVSDSNYVCVSSQHRNQIERAVETIERSIQILSIEELSEAAKEEPIEYESPAKPNDISYLAYTSGTTGFPKGVMHTHASIIRTGVRSEEVLGTKGEDRIYVYLPFFHAWAYLLMLGAMYFKATIIVVERFNAETYWEDVDKFKITQDHWTGTVPLNLLKLPKSDLEQKPNMTVYGTFGAMYETLKERWPNIRFQSLYGLTEHPSLTAVPADQILPGSDGIPKPPDEVLIVDESGDSLPRGSVGEIVVRCKCGVRMQGYYKNPEATARAIKGDDLYTGDRGYLDDRGHLHFAGRSKDALRIRGEMVSAEHLEHLINQHPKIAESAITGYVSPEKIALKEEEIVAHIVVKEGEQLTTQEFCEWSEKNLARFMRPKYVVFRKSLPKTATERVQRFLLRNEAIQGAVQLFG